MCCVLLPWLYLTYMVLEYCVGGLQEILDKAPKNKFPVWQAHKSVYLWDIPWYVVHVYSWIPPKGGNSSPLSFAKFFWCGQCKCLVWTYNHGPVPDYHVHNVLNRDVLYCVINKYMCMPVATPLPERSGSLSWNVHFVRPWLNPWFLWTPLLENPDFSEPHH